jgi:hypothetical protein
MTHNELSDADRAAIAEVARGEACQGDDGVICEGDCACKQAVRLAAPKPDALGSSLSISAFTEGDEMGSRAVPCQGEQALWELINPSDAVTFRTDDHRLAAIVTMLLGDGFYLAREMGGAREVPAFLYGGHDAWCERTFGTDLEGVLEPTKADPAPLAAVFRTVQGTQTSLNDIVGRADQWATQLEAAVSEQGTGRLVTQDPPALPPSRGGER